MAVVVGHPHREGRTRYNAASLLRGGGIERIYFKQRLPNYQVFDEKPTLNRRPLSPAEAELLSPPRRSPLS
jgi:predicted amidohydrolase